MATQANLHPSVRGSELTPLVALQIFSAGLIFTVCILSTLIFLLKTVYQWEPSPIGYLNYSPIYALSVAAACLILSFLIPEFLLDSTRRELKRKSHREQTEDLPFIFVPSVFIRFALLAFVTMIGFIMAFAGRGLSIFLPFAVVSLVLMVAYFPTQARMKHWLHNQN